MTPRLLSIREAAEYCGVSEWTVRSIRTAWDNARDRAKLKDHTFHGFRRTLRRRLDERGISEKVGMAIMGHKTRKIFDDYRVVSRADLQDAAKKLTDEKE